ncbi:hypothetical protein E4K65_26570 [Bradyrhizobium niftali]|uniref:Uncharacterized protein n=1 Tax=Bradyrhizobium niftali TaxID=2560055 RepID=A0A4Y9LMG7_9BRAD|nr:hypothetical protein E4K65_26570 [Bradyrhizobium niftali]
MIGDFVERALLPFLGLREPEHPALRIQRGALPAKKFLTANFHQPVHALTPLLCEANPLRINLAESRTPRLTISVHIATQNGTAILPVHCGSFHPTIKSQSSISDRGSGRYSCANDLNSCGATKCGNS